MLMEQSPPAPTSKFMYNLILFTGTCRPSVYKLGTGRVVMGPAAHHIPKNVCTSRIGL